MILAAIGFPLFFWYAKMTMESWYLLPFMALVVACFDAALPVFRGLLRVVVLAFVVMTALLSVPTTSVYLADHFSNVNIFARVLATEAAPRDYIIVCPWNFGITFGYYFKGAAPWETLPPLADHSAHRYDLIKLQMQNTNALTPVFRQISQTLQSGHRVWVLSDGVWIQIPKRGTPPIAPLPPPPLKYSGWADSPYSQVWASQMAHFITDHSIEFRQLPPPREAAGGKFVTENMTLFVADGWDTNSTP
jgi:hypothetical protein